MTPHLENPKDIASSPRKVERHCPGHSSTTTHTFKPIGVTVAEIPVSKQKKQSYSKLYIRQIA